MPNHDSVMPAEATVKQASGATSPATSPRGLSDFPGPLRDTIAAVCKRARLWKHERADVEAELVAHFHDGLAQGLTADKLLADFGDVKAAAKLIRRGKLRNRPLRWQVQHRLGQAIAVVFVLAVVLAAIHTVRFYTGRPTLAFRPLDVLNKDATALPAGDRAWPEYRAAYLALDLDQDQFKTLTELEPDASNLAEVQPLLERTAASIARIRSAAAKSGMGYVASIDDDEDLAIKSAILTGSVCLVSSSPGQMKPDPENPEAMAILLSHLTPVRSCARLLRSDAIAALHAADAARLHADLTALVAVARHMRSPDTYISSLVSVAVVTLTCDLIRDVLALNAALLSDDQLTELAHRLAALGGPIDFISLRGERLFFQDTLQRLYTDDGAGNGRLTAAGSDYFNKTASLGVDRANAGMLVASAFLADRKQVTQAYDSIMDRAESSIAVPLWIPVKESADVVLERYTRTAMQRLRYMPVAMFAPALDRARYAAHEVASNRDATLAVIALELHRRRTGAFPDALNPLIPGLLPTLPLDNADGQPLRYRRQPGPKGDSYLLYAIGTDRLDNGGTPATHANDAANIRAFGRNGKLQRPCDDVTFPRPRFVKAPPSTP
jgi:hypothetical protein